MSYYPITVLEVGTSSVKVLVGEPDDADIVKILGWGECKTAGMRKSEVTDSAFVREAVKTALEEAAVSSGVSIKSVVLVCSCGNPRCQKLVGTVNVTTGSGKIDSDTIDDAEESAESTRIDDSRMSICSARISFGVDGRRDIADPREMNASNLTVEKLRLHIDKNSFETLKNVVESVGVDVVSQTFTGICAANGCTSQEQRRDGVLVIDMGGGTTKWCAYKDGRPRTMGSLAVGGDHVTADLGTAFRLGQASSEKIKREYASAVVDASRCERTVSVNETLSQRSVSLLSANTVVNARISEMFEIIQKKLAVGGIAEYLNSGVVLCGGGACLNGVCEVAARIFRTPCTIADLPDIHRELDYRADNIAFAPVYGALLKTAKKEIEAESAKAGGGLFSWLRGRI